MNGDLDSAASASAEDSDVFAVADYVPHSPPRREFMPWHRPRKQWVRDAQWAAEIAWLRNRDADCVDDFRYLGLPGIDLLDVRDALSRFEWPSGAFRFLGFDRNATPGGVSRHALNVALSEVRARREVNPSSDVVGDELVLLANESSLAYETAHRHGPYDLLNIDLCGHLGGGESGSSGELFEAIRSIFGIQQRHRRAWVLLLTTRIGESNIDAALLDRLCQLIESNMQASSRFVREVEDHLTNAASSAATLRALPDTTRFPAFLETMSLGICKWILGMAVNARERFEVSSVAHYKVLGSASVPDMVSFAFRFTPANSVGLDASGVTRATDNLEHESSMACDIPAPLGRAIDVDELLARDSELRAAVEGQATELMEQARYDPTLYRAWIAAEGYRG